MAVMQSPQVMDISTTERIDQFWCCFCEAECTMHTVDQTMVLQHAGTIAHLSSLQHLNGLKKFWRENRNNKALNKAQFYMERASAERYWELLIERKAKFMLKKSKEIKADAIQINLIDNWRQSLLENERATAVDTTSSLISSSASTAKNYLSSNAEMCPPWLEADTSKELVIRPTLEDYQSHLNKAKKNALPAERVGVSFNRQESVSSSWLPSFGQVWNPGRRTRTKFKNKNWANTSKRVKK